MLIFREIYLLNVVNLHFFPEVSIACFVVDAKLFLLNFLSLSHCSVLACKHARRFFEECGKAHNTQERAQPASRKKLGLLEKKKTIDYVPGTTN